MSTYLTFPIFILKDGMRDIRTCCNNTMYYSLYAYCKDKEGSQNDLIEKYEEFFAITFNNKKVAYDSGRKLFNSIPENYPKASVLRKIIFDFYKNDKTEFEIVCFLAFCAIRSILQQQPYTKITNGYLIGRMAGNRSPKEELPAWIDNYNNRYQLDKIKASLQMNWGLKLFAYYTRGFYISFSLELQELIKHAELKRISYKEKELKRKKDQARKEVLANLNNRKS